MIPTFLSELVRTIIIMSITGGLLCLLLLAIKPIIRHRLPKSAQYYFWLVVLGALLIPVSRIAVLHDVMPNIVPIYNVVERNVVSLDEEQIRILAPQVTSPLSDQTWQMPQAARQATMPPPTLPLAPIITIFMLAYPFAFLLVLGYSLFSYTRFIRRLRRGYIKPMGFELDMLGEIAIGKRTPRLIKSTYAATPMLIGIFNPTIVLPNHEYSDEQLYGILLHELTHMRRFDIFVKWLSLFACAVHWFNPLVWITRRKIDHICELACDEAVIRNMNAYNKQNYGETLLAVASTKKIPLPVVSTTMCAEKQAVKERLAAIMKSKKHTKLTVLVSTLILLAVVLTACALGAARGTLGSEDTYGNDIFMDMVLADGGRVFVLENMTDEQQRNQMWAVSLFGDGTATLHNALYISVGIPPAPYNSFFIEENELVIYSNYQAFDGRLMARFTIIDNDTLELISATPPLMAREGTRFVLTLDDFDIFTNADNGIEPIPHVGAAHETQRIVNAMPLPSNDMTLRSIQIGADHGGFGYGAYTLTVHYDLHGNNHEYAPGAAFERISSRLLGLIENLQAVTFSVISNEEVDTDNYIYRWSISRTSSDAGGGAVTSFRGSHGNTNQIEQPTLPQIALSYPLPNDIAGSINMVLSVLQAGTNRADVERYLGVPQQVIRALDGDTAYRHLVLADSAYIPENDFDDVDIEAMQDGVIRLIVFARYTTPNVLTSFTIYYSTHDGAVYEIRHLGDTYLQPGFDGDLYRHTRIRESGNIIQGNAPPNEHETPSITERWRLFDMFELTETVSTELRNGFLMTYFANAPVTLTALGNVNAVVYRMESLSYDYFVLPVWEMPGWNTREYVQPSVGGWVGEHFDLLEGSAFTLESGVYLVMVNLGMDDHFIVVVGEENFPF